MWIELPIASSVLHKFFEKKWIRQTLWNTNGFKGYSKCRIILKRVNCLWQQMSHAYCGDVLIHRIMVVIELFFQELVEKLSQTSRARKDVPHEVSVDFCIGFYNLECQDAWWWQYCNDMKLWLVSVFAPITKQGVVIGSQLQCSDWKLNRDQPQSSQRFPQCKGE